MIMVLGALVVLGFVLRKFVVTDDFGENRMFWIASASALTFVVAGFFLHRRKLKNQN